MEHFPYGDVGKDAQPIRYMIRVPVLEEMYYNPLEDTWNIPIHENPVLHQTHITLSTWYKNGEMQQSWNHTLAEADQWFANSITMIVQRACDYFNKGQMWEPMDGVPEITISDDDVAERIRRLDEGENKREAERTNKLQYPLQDLPFDQQRAIVEQIELLKLQAGFEIIGEAVESSVKVNLAHSDGTEYDQYAGYEDEGGWLREVAW